MTFRCINTFEASNGKEYQKGIKIKLAEYNNLSYKDSCNFVNDAYEPEEETVSHQQHESAPIIIPDFSSMSNSDNGSSNGHDSGTVDFGNGGDFGGGGSTDSY